MSGKDLLRLLLIVFGFNEDMEISSYKGEGGFIGYDVAASNSSGLYYHEVDCEGLLFHMYEIISYMNENGIKPTTINGQYSIKEILEMTSKDLESLPIINRGDITVSQNEELDNI